MVAHLFAATAVLLASAGYENLAVAGLLVLIGIPLLILQLARPNESLSGEHEARKLSLKIFLAPAMLVGLWIAVTAGAGFEFFTVTAGPLLLELGGTPAQTSILFGVVAPLGLACGALAGGYSTSNLGARRGTITGMALVAAAVFTFVGLRQVVGELSAYLWLAPLGLLYAAAGFLIASSYTLFMRMSRGEYAATRFALFMSATNGCETWAAFVGGRLATPLGYNGAMLVLVAASVLALPGLLWRSLLKKEPESSDRLVTDSP